MEAPTKKRARNELSLKRKMALIRDSVGRSHRQLAKLYNVGRSQVGTILKNKQKFIDAFENNRTSSNRKRPKVNSIYDKVDAVTWEWFTQMRSMLLPVSGSMVQQQARKFAMEMGQPDFKASNGWLQRFKQRHSINCFRKCSLKPDEVDGAVVDISKYHIPLVQLMKHAVRNLKLDKTESRGDETSEDCLPPCDQQEDNTKGQSVDELDMKDSRLEGSCDERDIKPVIEPLAIESIEQAKKMAKDLKMFASVRGIDTVYHYATQIECELAKCL